MAPLFRERQWRAGDRIVGLVLVVALVLGAVALSTPSVRTVAQGRDASPVASPRPAQPASPLAARLPEGAAFDPADVSLIDVSIHAFASETGASAALPYLADARIAIMGIGYTTVDRLGDESLAVAGLRGDGVYEASIYLRLGAHVARVSVVSPQGGPVGRCPVRGSEDRGAAAGLKPLRWRSGPGAGAIFTARLPRAT